MLALILLSFVLVLSYGLGASQDRQRRYYERILHVDQLEGPSLKT